MADKKQEQTGLEREYIVPLRKKVQKVPRYRRAKKAIKVIKEFLAKNMKVEERDLNKIKIDKYLNQEIWFRGIKNPPSKIKVKAIKKSDGIVYTELVDIPEKVKWDMEREKRLQQASEKVKKSKKQEEQKPEKTKEQSEETKEKEKASVEAGLKAQKQQAVNEKHTAKPKQPKQTQIHRKAMKK